MDQFLFKKQNTYIYSVQIYGCMVLNISINLDVSLCDPLLLSGDGSPSPPPHQPWWMRGSSDAAASDDDLEATGQSWLKSTGQSR